MKLSRNATKLFSGPLILHDLNWCLSLTEHFEFAKTTEAWDYQEVKAKPRLAKVLFNLYLRILQSSGDSILC